MSTRADRGGAKVRRPAGGRRTPAAGAPLLARRAAASRLYPVPGVRPQLSSFVARCLRSWAAARTSATDFFASWAPLALPAARALYSRTDTQRRSLARPTRRRNPASPSDPPVSASASIWEVPIALAGSPEVLQARYPLVSALLVEMAAIRRPPRTVLRRQRKR
jgi:hypothetical protein